MLQRPEAYLKYTLKSKQSILPSRKFLFSQSHYLQYNPSFKKQGWGYEKLFFRCWVEQPEAVKSLFRQFAETLI
jgi:hypothetical protein